MHGDFKGVVLSKPSKKPKQKVTKFMRLVFIHIVLSGANVKTSEKHATFSRGQVCKTCYTIEYNVVPVIGQPQLRNPKNGIRNLKR